jgi:hypothetical protein
MSLNRMICTVSGTSRPLVSTGALLTTLTAAIQESFAHIRRTESGTQHPVLTLRLGHGSCRDLALLMMEAYERRSKDASAVAG